MPASPSPSKAQPVRAASQTPATATRVNRTHATRCMSCASTCPVWTMREPPVKGYRPWVLAASAPLMASAWSFNMLAAACSMSASTTVTHASAAEVNAPAAWADAIPRTHPMAVTTRKPGRAMRTQNVQCGSAGLLPAVCQPIRAQILKPASLLATGSAGAIPQKAGCPPLRWPAGRSATAGPWPRTAPAGRPARAAPSMHHAPPATATG